MISTNGNSSWVAVSSSSLLFLNLQVSESWEASYVPIISAKPPTSLCYSGKYSKFFSFASGYILSSIDGKAFATQFAPSGAGSQCTIACSFNPQFSSLLLLCSSYLFVSLDGGISWQISTLSDSSNQLFFGNTYISFLIQDSQPYYLFSGSFMDFGVGS